MTKVEKIAARQMGVLHILERSDALKLQRAAWTAVKQSDGALPTRKSCAEALASFGLGKTGERITSCMNLARFIIRLRASRMAGYRNPSTEDSHLDTSISRGENSKARLDMIMSGDVIARHLPCNNSCKHKTVPGEEISISNETVTWFERRGSKTWPRSVYRATITYVPEEYRKAMRILLPLSWAIVNYSAADRVPKHLHFIYVARQDAIMGRERRHRFSITCSISANLSPKYYRALIPYCARCVLKIEQKDLRGRNGAPYNLERLVIVSPSHGYKLKLESIYIASAEGISKPILFSTRYRSKDDSWERALAYAERSLSLAIGKTIRSITG